ncbi:MAG: GNAT family N-acetyltransferase, partial [Saprospiraceae bacterium]|nr:GNAT family N-acetyltransferase [Saprospiraceae bacterium]
MQKHDYRLYSKRNVKLPLFHQPWWLDALASANGSSWDVALSRSNDGNIIAAWPYFSGLKLGMNISLSPVLGSYLGIWIDYPEENWKEETRQSYQNNIVKDLLPQLPEFYLMKQNFTPTFDNWKELYWAGYDQTTYYTYVLDNIKDHESVFAGFKSNLRNSIKKLGYTFSIGATNDLVAFYEINKKSWSVQDGKIPYTLDYLQKLDDALINNGNRYIRLIKDANNNIVAGAYIVRDNHTAYNLMLGTDPNHRHSRAAEILLWDVIQEMSQYVDRFDFEGSMIEGVSQFFK